MDERAWWEGLKEEEIGEDLKKKVLPQLCPHCQEILLKYIESYLKRQRRDWWSDSSTSSLDK